MTVFLKKYKSVLLVAFTFMFLIFVYAPVSLYFSDINEFPFDIADIAEVMLPGMLLACVLLSAFLVLVQKITPAVGEWLLFIFCYLLVACFLQGNFLSDYLPSLDGSPVDWSEFNKERFISLLLWCILAVIFFFLRIRLKKSQLKKMITAISGIVACFLLLTLFLSGFSTDGFTKKENIVMTDSHMYEMSEDRNFIILVLDSADSKTFNSLRSSHPEYDEIFKDFTYYRNTLGAYSHTVYAVPMIFSGEWFEHQEDSELYKEKVFQSSGLLKELKALAYTCCFYESDYTYLPGMPDIFDNFSQSDRLVRPLQFLKMQLMFTGYRFFPFDLKKYTVLTPENIEYDSEKKCASGEAFLMDNTAFYQKMKSSDVSIVHDKCFKYIHIMGAHAPFQYDKDLNIIENGTEEQNTEAAIKIAADYILKLKNSSTYDNSIIVIMADHGQSGEEPYGRQNPLLLIKNTDEVNDTLKLSNAPVSHADLSQAFSALAGGVSQHEAFPFPEGDSRTRRYVMIDTDHPWDLVEYEQNGYAWDDSSLVKTGRVFRG